MELESAILMMESLMFKLGYIDVELSSQGGPPYDKISGKTKILYVLVKLAHGASL